MYNITTKKPDSIKAVFSFLLFFFPSIIRKIGIAVILILLTGMMTVAHAQITGTKTIPGDYSTIADAVTVLNSSGVGSGGVTFEVAAGHTETLSGKITMTATGTQADPIVFRKSGTGANPILTSYTGTNATPSPSADGFWAFVGSDYVTIDGIDLQEAAGNTTATTVMEFGYGFYKVSDMDGCRNNMVKNCTITMNRVQNAPWSGTSGYFGSCAIVFMNTTNTSDASLTPTAASGTNSNNKLYSNTIQNCNTGVVLIGYGATSGVGANPDASTFLGDLNNDIGGSTATTGNTIKNFGGGIETTSNSAGVYTVGQWSTNVSYNTINNNDGGGVNHPGDLRGIYLKSAQSANSTANYNRLALKSDGTSHTVSGIEVAAGSTANGNTINMNYNSCTIEYLTATSGSAFAFFVTASAATINFIGDTINGINLSASTLSGDGLLYGIYSASSQAGTAYAYGNTVTNISRTGTTTFNTFGLSLVGTTSIARKNSVSSISIGGSGTTGALYGIQVTSPTSTVDSNTVTGLNINKSASTADLVGIYCKTPSSSNETITNNTVYGLSHAGPGSVSIGLSGIYYDTGPGTRTCSGNLVYNMSGATQTVSGIGLRFSTTNFFNNKIYDISSTNTAPTVSGLLIGVLNGPSKVYNNLIGDIKAPNAVSTSNPSVRGISMSGSSTNYNLNLNFNTVYLNATSLGVLHTAAFYALASSLSTTAALFMNNNIFINKSGNANGGRAVAYWRSNSNLANYRSGDRNLYYAGTPGANNLIFYDGTNSEQSISGFKTRMNTRDQNSDREDCSTHFTSTTGSDAGFLHFNSGAVTLAESTASPITNITTDYEGNTRNATTPDIGADEFSGYRPCTSPTLSAAVTDVTCPAGADGAINLTTTGGSPTPFTYAWSNGATTEDLSAVAAGTYTVTVTITSSTCSATASYTVNTINSPMAVITNNTGNTELNCVRTAISLTASGGDSYLWSGGLGSDANASVTIPDAYTVTVTDANGCTDTESITITQDISAVTPVITIGGVTTFCDGGQVQLTSSSAVSYLWSTGANTAAIQVSASGSYVVTATYANGCTAASVATSVTVIPNTSNTTSVTDCFSYTWSVNSQVYTQSGTYSSVSVCHTEILNLQLEKPHFIQQPSSISHKTTPGIAMPSYTVAVSGGSGHTYQWYSNTTQTNTGGTLIPGAQSTTYLPPTQSTGTTWYYVRTTTSNGCQATSEPSGFIQVCGQ